MTLQKYIDLLSRFQSGDMSASDFEGQYIKAFKGEASPIDGPYFSALNDLFFDVDSYCDDPCLRDDGDIDGDELKNRARAALGVLRKNAV